MKMLSLFLIIAACSSVSLAATLEDHEKALRYLIKYQYTKSSVRSDIGSGDFKEAVETFQKFFKLEVTGKLNNETLKVMNKARCGNPDVQRGSHRNKRYKLFGGRWGKKHLTYYFEPGKDFSEAAQRRIIQEAFNKWSRHTDLIFTPVANGKRPDFKISFGYYSHVGTKFERKCRWDFDGYSGVLAHAFTPPDGRIHFDDSEAWRDGGLWLIHNNLLEVAVHEIGHTLGLDHSNEWPSIMWPTYYHHSRVQVFRDDVDGIQTAYGVPDIKYTMSDKGENCNNACEKQSRKCAAIGHNFAPEGALSLFKTLGISCKSGSNGYYKYPDNPGYMVSGGWAGQCIGYLNIPDVINCEAGTNKNYQRLCPCKR